MHIIFIRHGKTQGNIEKRYIGTTNQPLADAGINEIMSKKYPAADFVAVSPLKRCIQTAELIYGSIFCIYDDLRECDFGNFENKNYEELKDDKEYLDWLSEGGCCDFPNGETYSCFSKRCCSCFENIIGDVSAESIAFVVHGGTIMSILEKYCTVKKPFYDWQIKNGDFLRFDLEYINGSPALREFSPPNCLQSGN